MSVLQSKRRAIINEPHKATSSGAVVTMDKAEYAPMGVVANFAPVQDLHGQASPYPAGGGKNLFGNLVEGYFDATGAIHAQSASLEYYTVDYYSVGSNTTGAYQTWATNPNTDSWCGVACYDEDKTFISRVHATRSFDASGYAWNLVTFAEGTKYIRISMRTFGSDKLMFELGSTPTDYAPYSNICPISGWTGCNVYDDSKYGGLVDWNQLVENGNFTDTTDWTKSSQLSFAAADNVLTVTMTAESPNNLQHIATVTPLVTGHKYLAKCQIKSNKLITSRLSIGGVTETIASAPDITLTATDTWTDICGIISAITTGNDTKLRIYVNRNTVLATNDTVSIRTVNMFDLTQDFGETIANEIYAMEQAEAGAGVAYFKSLFYKSYYPYNAGQQMTVGQVNGDAYRAVNVDWTDEAGTVYGGSLDVAKGVLTAKYRLINLGDYTWTKHSSGKFFYMAINTAKYQTGGSYLTNAKCTDYKATTPIGVTTTNMSFSIGTYHTAACNVYVRDERYLSGTATAFKTAMSGVYLCYELATPITYTLTPTQIKSLRGKNNVWTDMNAPTDVSAWVH